MSVKVCVTVDCESPTPTGNGNGGTPPPNPVSTFSQLVGDGTNTSFTVAHNLDSDFVSPSVRHVPTGEIRYADSVVAVLDRNSLSLTFSAPPGVEEYAIYVLAIK